MTELVSVEGVKSFSVYIEGDRSGFVSKTPNKVLLSRLSSKELLAIFI